MRWLVVVCIAFSIVGRKSAATPKVLQLHAFENLTDSLPCRNEPPLGTLFKRLTRYAVLFPAYNDNDGFMAGIGITNVYRSDTSTLKYVLAPTYSFAQKKILGIVSLQYSKDVENAAFSSYFGGLTIRSFDMQRNIQLDYSLRYIAIRPYAGVLFANSDRPDVVSGLTFSAAFILEEEALYSSSGMFAGLQTMNSDIYRIRFEKARCSFGKMQGYSITAEQQRYGENHYVKISGDLTYAYPYRQDRFVYVRFFGAAFPLNTRRKAMGYQNTFTRGTIALIHQGFNDYAYDESFFSRRNQDRTFDNQISLDEGGGFKTPAGSAYNIGMSNDFAASVNWSADTPFKTGPVDLRIFIDAGIYRIPENGKMKAKSLYSGGFSLHYRDIGALHLPVVFNKELANTYQEAHTTFFSRISFSLNINRLVFGRPKHWNGI